MAYMNRNRLRTRMAKIRTKNSFRRCKAYGSLEGGEETSKIKF